MLKIRVRSQAWAVAVLAAFSMPPLQAQPANPAPIQVPTEELLAAYPVMTGFRLSRDGKHMLAIESKGDVRNILVWKTADLAAKPQVIGASSMRISSAIFLKNDMLAVSLQQPYDARFGELEKTFISKLMVTDLAGKEWKEPLASVDVGRSEASKRLAALSVPSILSRMPADPDNVILETDGLGKDRDLYRYNVRTGESARVLRLGEKDFNVLVDASGKARARSRADVDSKGAFIAVEFRHPTSGEWEEHFRNYVKERDLVDVLRVGEKPNTFVLLSNLGRNFAGLYEYDVQQRKIVSTLMEHPFFDAKGIVTADREDDPTKFEYIGFTYRGPQDTEVQWVNPKYEAVVKGVAQALGIAEVSQQVVDFSTGKRAQARMLDGVSVEMVEHREMEVPLYLLRVSGLNYPTEHYLLRGQQLTLLAKEHPQLDRRALGKSRFVYYPARDGKFIPAMLTVPNEQLCGAGPYSAVIHPHGGPWARDDMQFDGSGWVPLLVSRCRVVLQPQYRGSDGWGRGLWTAGDAQWGQQMQDDKDDGAKWLVGEKLADPKRIAMFGFSYGGYAAFAAAVRPEGNYKCAIAGAGVSDIDKIWAAFYTNPFFRESQAPTVRGLSPARVADKIKIPIMVYHGERDQIVPLVQSQMFVDQARKSDQKVDYHVLKDYAHGPAWTRAIMTEQLKLISQYLGSGCGGAGL